MSAVDVSEKRGVAVIGCGDMGGKHAQAWQARDDAYVAAVYDPIIERRDTWATRTGARAFDSWQDAILCEEVECVSVCTPAAFHPEISCFALENGRHVLTEKAIALTLDQAEAMIAAARTHHRQLAVSYQYRAFGRNRKLRELFEAGTFGEPLFARFTDVREVRPKIAMHSQSLNGGPVIDMAGHYFDLMRFLTGTEPEAVFASGHVFGEGKPRLADVDDFAIDAASIEVRYGNGHTLTVFANWGMPEGFPTHSEEYVIGPLGSARAISGGGWEIHRGSDARELWHPEVPDPPGPQARIADLMNAITTGAPLDVSGEEGLMALRVCRAALASIESGRVVLVTGE